MTQQLSFGPLERRGDVCIVPVSGRIASGTHDDLLREKVQEIKNLGCNRLVADIRELDSIGSAGISFFVELYTSITKRPGSRFVLSGASARVREVLEITRVDTIL